MRARSKPQARARRTAKMVCAAKLSRAGSKVVQHEESVRRVVQCAGKGCDRTVQYRGDERLWSQGWGSSWVGATRTWECPTCWSPQKDPTTPIYRVDDAMLEVASEPPSSAAHQRLERQMVRLLDVDPRRGEIYLKAIVDKGGAGAGAARWRTMLDLVKLVPAQGRKRRRRLAPIEPYVPMPQIRRVMDEVASELVSVRLTPTEKKGAEELAAKTSAGSPGKMLRAYLQSALGGVLQPAAPSPPPPAQNYVDLDADLSPLARAHLAIGEMVDAIAVDDLEELADELAGALIKARRATKGTLMARLDEEPPARKAARDMTEAAEPPPPPAPKAAKKKSPKPSAEERRILAEAFRDAEYRALGLGPPPKRAVENDQEDRDELAELIIAFLEGSPPTTGPAILDAIAGTDVEHRSQVSSMLDELVRTKAVIRDRSGSRSLYSIAPDPGEELPAAPSAIALDALPPAQRDIARKLLEDVAAGGQEVERIEVSAAPGATSATAFIRARPAEHPVPPPAPTERRLEPPPPSADPLSLPCPKCKVPAGNRCLSENGAIRRTVAHEERLAPAPAEALAPAYPVTEAKINALAKRLKIKVHTGANSPENVWGCVERIRSTRELARPIVRKELYEARPSAGTDSVDLAVAYLVEAGELVHYQGKGAKEIFSWARPLPLAADIG